MKENSINVVIVEPGKGPYQAEIENTTEAFQETVNGYFRPYSIGAGFYLVANEEGAILGMEPNRMINGIMFVGPMFITHDDEKNEGEFRSLTQEEIGKVLDHFRPYQVEGRINLS